MSKIRNVVSKKLDIFFVKSSERDITLLENLYICEMF
jgi:hypothetical protein